MVALLIYAYARGGRSSRRIERACIEDIAYRVIAANQAPDHTTIARFRQRHEDAIAGLFSDVLRLCADAGLTGVELVAVDGTKVHADASQHANRDYEQIAREVLEQADKVDAQEDERFGDRRGDELPPELATSKGRRAWFREAKRQLDERRAADAKPIPASRPERLKESKRRLEEELWTECQANRAYEAYRARGVMRNGRRLGPNTVPRPYVAPEHPQGKINVTDPDSRNVKTPRGYMQGYNAQAVCNAQQIVIAAEVNADSPDFGHLQPMIEATERKLGAAGISDQLGVVVADAGYWHQEQMDRNRQLRHPSPDPARRRQTQRHPAGLGRRPLRVHAPRPSNRARRSALSQAQRHDRAGLRQHQVHPWDRPLPAPRKIGLPLRMATDHRHPQPPPSSTPANSPSQLPETRRGQPRALRNSHGRKQHDPNPAPYVARARPRPASGTRFQPRVADRTPGRRAKRFAGAGSSWRPRPPRRRTEADH